MSLQAAGIIAEYNPFHNGHLWQLQALRQKLGDAPVICCMSGYFVQRGEAALCSPHARAEAAVRNGADLVLLLPAWYSLRSADYFAFGPVKILAATGLVHTLVCSAEHGAKQSTETNTARHDLDAGSGQDTFPAADALRVQTSPAEISLSATAAWSLEKNAEKRVRQLMQQGLSYGAAWETSAKENGKDANWFSGANNLLALAYQKAILQHCPHLTMLLLPRQGSAYNENRLLPPFASASAIRKSIRDGAPLASLCNVMPGSSLSLLEKENAITPFFPSLREKILATLLSHFLSLNSSAALYEHSSASRDLCDRFYNTREKLREGYSAFCQHVANKRDSLPAVRRLALQLLLHRPRSFWTETPEPSYIRVLAFNDRGRTLLKEMKQSATLPVITKPGSEAQYSGTDLYPLLHLDAAAADLYQLITGNAGTFGTGFTTSPVYVKNESIR